MAVVQIERLLAVLAVLTPLTAGDALAQSPSYVGTWAANAKQCAIDQSMRGAPLILKRNGYDQHEAHCTFTSVNAAGPDTWRVRARCSVEGDKQNHTLTLTVKGNRLTLRDGRGARTMVR